MCSPSVALHSLSLPECMRVYLYVNILHIVFFLFSFFSRFYSFIWFIYYFAARSRDMRLAMMECTMRLMYRQYTVLLIYTHTYASNSNPYFCTETHTTNNKKTTTIYIIWSAKTLNYFMFTYRRCYYFQYFTLLRFSFFLFIDMYVLTYVSEWEKDKKIEYTAMWYWCLCYYIVGGAFPVFQLEKFRYFRPEYNVKNVFLYVYNRQMR